MVSGGQPVGAASLAAVLVLFGHWGGATAKNPLYNMGAHAVPGHIEIEDFVQVGGDIRVAETPRIEVGLGEIIEPATGSSVTYEVNVAATGSFDVQFRYRKTTPGSAVMAMQWGGGSSSVSLGQTTPGDSFQTASARLALNGGNQTLTLLFTSGDWDKVALNWMAFKQVQVTASPKVLSVVPASGNDSLPDGPFKTVQAAVNRVAQLVAGDPAHGPIEIHLAVGYHEVTATINLTTAHTGTVNGPITLRKTPDAKPGDVAMLGAGRQVPLSSLELVTDDATLARFKAPARGKVYRAHLDDPDWRRRFTRKSADSLFEGLVTYDAVDLMLARKPNIGLELATGIPNPADGSFTCEDPIDAKAWASELERSKLIYVSGHITADEFEEHTFVTNVSADGRIQVEKGQGPMLPHRTLRILNVLAELDMPGEWYYDAVSGDFFIWPVASLDLKPVIRVGSYFELFVAESVSYWTVEGVALQDVAGSFDFNGPPTMFHFDKSSDVTFAGNTVRNTNARVAARFDDCLRCIVRSNDFYDVGCPFGLNGPRGFPAVQSQNVFSNNYITRLRARAYGGGGLGGAGIVFSNNLVHSVNAGQSYTQTLDLLIEQNEWYDLGYEEGDFNVAYVGGSYFTLGNVVRHNLVHNMQQAPYRRRIGAWRYDDGAAAMTFVGNMIYSISNYGLAFSGHAGTVLNNVLANTQTFLLSNQGTGLIGREVKTPQDLAEEWHMQLDEVPNPIKPYKGTFIYNAEQVFGDRYWLDPYFAYKYPLVKKAYDINPFVRTGYLLDTNYICNGGPFPLDAGGNRSTAVSRALEGINGTLPVNFPIDAFVNVSYLDLNFKPGFQRQPNFYDIPVDGCGLVTDEFRKATPHKRTYRAWAVLKWKDGAGVQPHDPSTYNNAYPDRVFNKKVSYDAGSYTSPLFHRAQLLTPWTQGTYGWVNPQELVTYDRQTGNAFNTDVIQSAKDNVFEQDVENGQWYALVTFGDYASDHDMMSVQMEDVPFEPANRNFTVPKGSFVNKLLAAAVTDGKLTLRFSDGGGANPTWSISRIITQTTPFDGQ